MAPSDPATAANIQKAADGLAASLAKACPSGTAGLPTCGTDAASVTPCVRCAHGREAIATLRAAYGPP